MHGRRKPEWGAFRFEIALQRYIFHNIGPVSLVVIDSREEGYALQVQLPCYARSHQLVPASETGNGALAQKALDYSFVVDEALPYISSMMFRTLHKLVANTQMYMLKNEELSA